MNIQAIAVLSPFGDIPFLAGWQGRDEEDLLVALNCWSSAEAIEEAECRLEMEYRYETGCL